MKSWLCHVHIKTAALLGVVLVSVCFAPLHAADQVAGQPPVQPDTVEQYVSPTNAMGSWIWEDKTLDDQTCQLWKSFEIPKDGVVTNGQLVLTVDNEFTLYLDGQELGHGAEWRELFVFDVTRLLSPGRHVVAVKCYNGSFFAGMTFGLQACLSDGRIIEVKSDNTWVVVPNDIKRWEKMTEPNPAWPTASIIVPLGSKPWWTQPEYVNRMPLRQSFEIHFWQKGWFQITLLSLGGLVILVVFRLTALLAFHRNERRLLQQERARIAREIHDDIGSRMTQLVLDGEEVQSDLSADPEMQTRLVHICDEARGLLSTMDEILWAVNPRRDTLRDFATYVCKYAQKFLKSTQIQCLLEVEPEISATSFDLPLRRSLFMAIKESLNNAVKHSGATELLLKIKCQEERLVVVVQDNGKGFDLAAVKPDRNGLVNMAQRMTQIGGRCLVASHPGQGCQVEFSVPFQQRRPWRWMWNADPFSDPVNGMPPAQTHQRSQNHDPTQF